MSIITILIVLVVIGVLLWLVNSYGAAYIDGKILKIINIAVVVFVVLWILTLVFPGILGTANSVRIGG